MILPFLRQSWTDWRVLSPTRTANSSEVSTSSVPPGRDRLAIRLSDSRASTRSGSAPAIVSTSDCSREGALPRSDDSTSAAAASAERTASGCSTSAAIWAALRSPVAACRTPSNSWRYWSLVCLMPDVYRLFCLFCQAVCPGSVQTIYTKARTGARASERGQYWIPSQSQRYVGVFTTSSVTPHGQSRGVSANSTNPGKPRPDIPPRPGLRTRVTSFPCHTIPAAARHRRDVRVSRVSGAPSGQSRRPGGSAPRRARRTSPS